MKKLCFIILLCFLSTFVKAEYDSYTFQLRVTTIDNQTFDGFVQTYDSRFDCTNSLADSLLLNFILHPNSSSDTFYFSKNYFCYDIQEYGAKIGNLIDPSEISKNQIKNIEVVDYFWMTTLCWIENEITLKDYEWTKTHQIDYQYYTPFCEYEFYIHEWSDGLQDIIDEIVKEKKLINSYGTSSNYEKALQKLTGRKVILAICC